MVHFAVATWEQWREDPSAGRGTVVVINGTCPPNVSSSPTLPEKGHSDEVQLGEWVKGSDSKKWEILKEKKEKQKNIVKKVPSPHLTRVSGV